MKKRIFSLLLAALLTSSAIGCGTDTPEEIADADTGSAIETSAHETEPEYLDELPEDLDLDGMNVHFGCNGEHNVIWDINIYYNIGNEELVGEIVQDAVYNRNLKVMERLNFTMNTYSSQNKWADWAKEISTSVLAGDDQFQILILSNNASLQSGNSYCFLDLSENEYIDISKPYWWGDAIMELSTDTKEYRYLMGDMMLTDYFAAALTYFNKDIYTNIFGDPNDMYNLALEGKWTLEKMKQMCEQAYVDTDGNGEYNEGDQFGLRFTKYWMEALNLDFSCNYRRITRDENGAPVVDVDMEAASYVYEMLYDLIYNVPGLGYTDVYEKDAPNPLSTFSSGNVLFKASTISDVLTEGIRDLDAAYGMVPNPKMNEEQEEYITFMSPEYCSIPITCQDVPGVSAVIEALASEAYISVIDDFYEVALQKKYSPDDISAQCMDLALDGAFCDFMYAYSSPLNMLGHMVASTACQGSPLASDYTKRGPAAQTSIDKYIASLKEQTAGAAG